MRGKCERGQGSANVGAEVQTWTGRVRKAMRAMGARRGRLSAPWPRFHGVDRADVYIIIHVRACCCGECELNPPPSPPIPRRRSSLTPPHSDTTSPSTSARPRSPDARPQTARCTPADLTTHSPPKTSPRPRTATRPPRTLPLPHATPTHAHAVPNRARRLRDARPPPSQPIPRCATLPPLLFRFGHKTTAPHSESAMPNVSVDRRCGRSFGLVSRALFGAVAGRWRVGVGLRPQPWALRSRRCGRVLRA